MALYKIKSGEGLQPIPQKDFGVENYEERLEDLLEKTPQIPEGEDILFIGRQVNSEYGILDLLALKRENRDVSQRGLRFLLQQFVSEGVLDKVS